MSFPRDAGLAGDDDDGGGGCFDSLLSSLASEHQKVLTENRSLRCQLGHVGVDPDSSSAAAADSGFCPEGGAWSLSLVGPMPPAPVLPVPQQLLPHGAGSPASLLPPSSGAGLDAGQPPTPGREGKVLSVVREEFHVEFAGTSVETSKAAEEDSVEEASSPRGDRVSKQYTPHPRRSSSLFVDAISSRLTESTSSDCFTTASRYVPIIRHARRAISRQFWWIDGVVGLVIIVNLACIGVEIQTRQDGHEPPILVFLEHIFILIFLLELLLRLFANPNGYMNTGWFYLDGGCVAAGVLMEWIVRPILSAVNGTSATKAIGNVTIIKSLRLIRLVRVFRLLLIAPELSALCMGLMASARTVASACVLLFITVYVLACLCFETIRTSDALNSDPITKELVDARYSSLVRTTLTLMSFTNGDDLASMYEPMISRQPLLGLFFLIVWIVITVSLMNLVTAIIVNTAIEQHKANDHIRRTEMRKRIKLLTPQIEALFNALDKEGEGKVELHVLNSLEYDADVPHTLAEMLSVEKLQDLFTFLDQDGSGSVDKAEFVDGILHVLLQAIPIETTQILQLCRSHRAELSDLCDRFEVLDKRVAGAALSAQLLEGA